MNRNSNSTLKTVTDLGFCAGYTWLSWAVTTATLPLERKYKLSDWFVRNMWSRGMLKYYGAEVKVTGLENVDPDETYVFISNHESLFDILVIYRTVPVSLRFVAKKALFYVPFFGLYLKQAGHIQVDRSNRQKAIESLDRAAEQIRAGTPIVAFPEGSRTEVGSVSSFKKGPFMLALKAGVPIVPVSIAGTGELLPKNALSAIPGRACIHYGEPIDLTGKTTDDRDEVIEEVRNAIIRNREAIAPGAGTR